MSYQIDGVKFLESSNGRALIADEQGLGKAQSVDSKLLTNSGWVRMGDITVGDTIISDDGISHLVSAIFPQGLIEAYQIQFNDGSSTICSDDHLWDVKSPNDVNRGANWRTMKTSELRVNLKTSQGYPKWMIPVTKPVHFPYTHTNDMISPYQLGCLLGDGCFRQNSINITSIDEEIYSIFPHIRKDKITYFLDAKWWHEIKRLGLIGTNSESKFIPEHYKFSSERLELLRGLMDTDGSIWNNGVIEYSSVSPKLAQGVIFLVESLGGICKLSSKIGSYTYKGEKLKGKKVYRVVINIPINPFKLKRKANQYQERDKYKPNRYIVSITPIGLTECQCITVDSPSHLYLTDHCIVTHNTVQAAAFLSLHGEVTYPVVIVTKTTLKLQWFYELIRWTGNRSIQVIQSSKEKAIPKAFDIYITTYDLLKDEKVFSDINPKTLILDECQAIKNHLSGRAKAVQRIGAACEHIIGLSGTPIKNNAGEYFTILNLLQPKRFPEFSRYLRTYCDSYETQFGYRVGGLSSVELFRQQTDEFIIRRTKAEVLPDLPSLTRNFYHVELDKKLESAYDSASSELEALFYKDDDENTMTSMIAVMTKLRQICGVSKVTECADFVTDFLLSCDRKIVVFVHHHAVTSLLEQKLNSWLAGGGFDKCLMLTAEASSDKRAETVKQFKDSNNRILIASTLAAGEGLNLQFCSDAIMLERQWNPANEEQAEARFHRFGQLNPVTVTYALASGTIDEYFSDIVEQKRAIVSQTLDGVAIQWDQQSLIKELAAVLVSKGRKKWTL